jgi:hypothetical protein
MYINCSYCHIVGLDTGFIHYGDYNYTDYNY